MLTDLSFLEDDAVVVAQRLLGCILERELDGHPVRVRIVETEAYDQSDAASHSHKGRTPRTDIMFGPAGHLYVYFTYGMHYCCNVVTGPEGTGSAVLIRAVEPIDDNEELLLRTAKNRRDLTNGPAKLCQALGVNKTLNGHNLLHSPLRLIPATPLPSHAITRTTRIGISRAKDALWRFYVTGNEFVSQK